MKSTFLISGFAGFCLTFAVRIAADADIALALRDGMVGCLILALVAKWVHGYVMYQYETALARKKSAESAETAKGNRGTA